MTASSMIKMQLSSLTYALYEDSNWYGFKL